VFVVTNEVNIVNTAESLVLAVAQLLKKFLAFHRTGMFMTVFKTTGKHELLYQRYSCLQQLISMNS